MNYSVLRSFEFGLGLLFIQQIQFLHTHNMTESNKCIFMCVHIVSMKVVYYVCKFGLGLCIYSMIIIHYV